MSSITRKWIRGANRVLEAPRTRLEVREGGERVDIPCNPLTGLATQDGGSDSDGKESLMQFIQHFDERLLGDEKILTTVSMLSHKVVKS